MNPMQIYTKTLLHARPLPLPPLPLPLPRLAPAECYVPLASGLFRKGGGGRGGLRSNGLCTKDGLYKI